jgi:hypothetical protein
LREKHKKITKGMIHGLFLTSMAAAKVFCR